MSETNQYRTNSLGYPLVFPGPKTIEEYNAQAGPNDMGIDPVLLDACENIIYRSTLPEWQDKFGERLEAKYGKRNVDQAKTDATKARSKKPESVKDVFETWTKYHNRIKAEIETRATAGDEAAKAELATLAQWAQETATDTVVDPSPSKRAGGIGKEYKDKAASLLTLPSDQLEAKITKMLDNVGEFTLDRDAEDDNKPTQESLARLVKAHIAKLMANEV